jgi:hypothetical protein
MVSLEIQIKETFLNLVEDNSQPDLDLLLGQLEKERNDLLKFLKKRGVSRAVQLGSGVVIVTQNIFIKLQIRDVFINISGK